MDNVVDNEPEELEGESLFDEEIDEVNEEDDLDSSEEIVQPSFEIAGFWSRFIAFFIDGAIVSIPLFIFGFLFKDISFSLGPNGIFLGYGLFILYWGIFNSELKRGQTIGKRALKITVVDQHSSYLTIKTSFLRAFILGVILILGEWTYSSFGFPIVGVIISLIGSVGMVVLLYGLIFNRTTRQGTHDLIVKSYVIKIPPMADAEPFSMPQKHKRFMMGISIVVALISIGSTLYSTPTFGIIENDEWDEIVALQAELQEKEGVFSAGVERLNRTSFNSNVTLEDLNITLWIAEPCGRDRAYCDELVNDTARLAFETFEGIENLDGMKITILNRFDFGIPQGNSAQGAQLTMEDWEARLSE